MKVLAIGNTIVDQVIIVDTLSQDGKAYIDETKTFVGGQAGNAAETMAHLGLGVSFVTRFGDDSYGVLAQERYRSAGINLDHALTVPGAATATAYVIVSRSTGKRSILMKFDQHLVAPALPLTEKTVLLHDIVYLDGYEQAVALQAARLAYERAIPVISDLEIISPNTEKLLPYVHTLIAPAEVVEALGGQNSLEDNLRSLMCSRFDSLQALVATQGENGATGMDTSGSVFHVPARPCQVVDSTGAGDAYHAGYVKAFSEGLGLEDAMRYAGHIAALKCQVAGPRLTRDRLIGS